MVKKVTFTLDDSTIRRLEVTADRLQKAKSEVVREAIADYHERMGRLSEVERLRLLKLLDEIASRPSSRRSAGDVKREIAEVRAARRMGGRRSG
jgi:predicted DNA-binding protein